MLSGSIKSIQPTKLMLPSPVVSKKPRKMRFGGVPMGVVIPLMLAPKATASKNLVFKTLSSVIESAIGTKSRATVEFDKALPKITLAVPKAVIMPFGVLGKRESKLLAMILCKPIFSTAVASIKPPKNKNTMGFA